MATATETLQATLSETEYRTLSLLAGSTDPLSGRKVASALTVAPTTANDALRRLSEAGFVTSEKSGRATLWRLAVSHPSISEWLQEALLSAGTNTAGSSPYSTGGGGVRLEHTYAAYLIAGLLAGEALTELGDSIAVDSIRLQASDQADVDDILIKGRDRHGEVYRSSIAVRRTPLLTESDADSVPLIRDFLAVVLDQWATVWAGRWRLVLAVSSNANAITQLSDLAQIARSMPSGEELEARLTQPGRTSKGVRGRYGHVKGLVEQAADGLTAASRFASVELTWRLLSSLTVRTLRLERTDRTDRTVAVNTLQRVLYDGTPAAADALFSRIEELVGTWAPQGAVLDQSVIRRNLGDYRLLRSTRFVGAWAVMDRLGLRLRNSISPSLRAGSEILELERSAERSRVDAGMKSAGGSSGSLVVTGEPDVGKSALCLRAAEALRNDGAAVTSLSLRDLPQNPAEFEGLLGGFSLDDVLATSETGSVRLLLVDGAESALEGKAAILQALSASALKAGVGVVAVTRTDGSRQVREILARSSELAGIRAAPTDLVLSPLTQDERNQLAGTFPTLARLGSDERAKWLLGRPGLVDALLRTGEELDPAKFLCEADVFSAVWRSLIRCDEERPTGMASPDDREQATLAVAKRSLGLRSDYIPGSAAAELRSDGVLRLPNNPALSPVDEFSTDLFRDFALCRLFIVEGWQALATAGAPRWSIRATRLGCQAALVTPQPSAWNALTTQFAQIANEHGERWSEIPFEALLTLGNAEEAIRGLWDALTADDGAALATLLRLAESRYVDGTIGDPFALAPLVRVAFCERPTIGNVSGLGHRTVLELIKDLVLAWLRGMATSHPQPDRLRQAVRDTVLADDPPRYDKFAIEALATLGPDLDNRADAWLRAVAQERPGNLNPAVESFSVSLSMSQACPKLLLDLAEAYYIELPKPRSPWSGGHELDDGIRDFQHGLWPGFGVSAAAWFYGPFFRLLNTRPIETIGFINRMLNHAAKFRVAKGPTHRDDDGRQEVEGVRLDLPGSGERLFVGDGSVWSWYRGTDVGPRACMSALLALERFADHLLEKLDIPARRILELLLTDCHNLAVPGLVVGFLTRHPESVGDLLDPFLASPDIWHLESARVTNEHGVRARDSDADKLTGSDQRRWTFHQTVGGMVVNARVAGDEERLARLSALGEKLVASARAKLQDAQGNFTEYLALIESWAAEFRIENYHLSTSGNHILIEFERPEPIERILAPRNAELQATNALYTLQNRYGRFNNNPDGWSVEDLADDLATARAMDETESVPADFLWPENGLVSVAAAAVRSHGLGLASIDDADLRWAVEATLLAAENPQIDGMSYHGSMFSMGADRAAAAAVPLLLLPASENLDLNRERVDNALRALATSLFDEVRAIYVEGCAPLWDEPCHLDAITGKCQRHWPAWTASLEGLRDCRLGPWDQETQRREPDPLPPPFNETLPTVADDALLVNRLRMPLSCMVDARQVSCVRDEVGALWAPLWDAYRRGLAHWWEEGYDHHETNHEPIARRMIKIALDRDRELVKAFIQTLASSAKALHQLFDGFATVFTYDDETRSLIREFWPWALAVALDAVDERTNLRIGHHSFDYMVAALMPTPSPHSWDPDIDGTFANARKHWIQPADLGDLGSRWLSLARWEPKAIDAVIKFGKSAPRAWQTSVELDWIEILAGDRYDLIANRLYYLEEWFGDLRSSGLILGEVKPKYHRIVDGLAAAGDRAAVRLQLLDE